MLTACEQDQDIHPDPAHKLPANLYVLLCVHWKTPDDGLEELSETCSFLLQKLMWKISASGWFYYKKLVIVFCCILVWHIGTRA